jgi:hypothetical protein
MTWARTNVTEKRVPLTRRNVTADVGKHHSNIISKAAYLQSKFVGSKREKIGGTRQWRWVDREIDGCIRYIRGIRRASILGKHADSAVETVVQRRRAIDISGFVRRQETL